MLISSDSRSTFRPRDPNKAIFAAIAIIFAGCAAVLAYKQAYSPEARFLASCDEVIMDRLKSPSSYQRISDSLMERRDASLNEYLGNPTPDQVEAAHELVRKNPSFAETQRQMRKAYRPGEHDRVSVLIEYDAENSFGTALRHTSECFTVVPKGADPAQAPSFTYVDGYTPLGWSIKAIKDQK